MKTSVKYLLILFVTGILVCIVADYFLQKGFQKSNDDVIGKLNEIIDRNTNYKIVCFGSSRGLAHINPAIIEKETGLRTFNAGLNGGCIIDFNALLQAYLSKHPSPEIMVIHVDEFTFTTETVTELPRYLPYISNDQLYENFVEYDRTFMAVKYVPFLRLMYYSDLLKWISFKSWLNIDSREEYKMVDGFRFNDSHWNIFLNDKLPWRYDMISKIPLSDETDKPGEELFKKILQICKQHNIKIILTSSPLIGGNDFEKYDHVCEKFEIISKDYDASYLWLHREQWDPWQYYYDYTHMNSKGAEKFSLLLADFINKQK